MSGRSATWAIPAIVYAAFFAWYTNLSGPLDADEIAHYLHRFESAELAPERIAKLRRFSG